MRNVCCVLVFAFLSWSLGLGNVDIRTSIEDVCYRGSFERVGLATFSVNGDDFFEAGPDTPIYFRIRLDKGAVNATTLVDIESSQGGHRPIFLAMRLEGNTSSASMVAGPSTVSIVRWRADESEIWLKVDSSSSTWIDRDGTLGPPNVDTRVAFTFGLTERESAVMYRGYNRTSNGLEDGTPADTSWIVDFTESIMTSMPQLNSEINFDMIHLDWNTIGVTTFDDCGDIVLGQQTSASFGDYGTVARGRDYNRVFPWITDNAQFESWIVINNLVDQATSVELAARRDDGVSQIAERVIPAMGFVREPAASLFPNLSGGKGYAVKLESCDRQLFSSWLTFSSASEMAQMFCGGSISDTREHDWLWQTALHFSFLPHNRSYLSSIAVTNLGSEPAVLTVLGYSSGGERVFRHEISDVRPGESIARMTHDFEGVEYDIHLVVASDQPISGVAYIFHFQGDVASYSAQPIDPELLPFIDAE